MFGSPKGINTFQSTVYLTCHSLNASVVSGCITLVLRTEHNDSCKLFIKFLEVFSMKVLTVDVEVHNAAQPVWAGSMPKS